MLFFAQNALTQPGQLHFSNYLIFAKPMRCFVRKRKRGRGVGFGGVEKAGRWRGNETRRARPTVDNKRASVPAPASRGWGGLTGKALARAWPSTQHQNRLHIDCSWQKATRCSSSQSPQRSGLNNQLYKHPASLSKVGQKGSSHFEFSGVYMSNTRHAHTGVQLRLDLSEEWIQTPTDGFQSWN